MEGGTIEDEESRRALAQVEHERKHGGPGQEPATDPNAKVAWLEAAKAEREDIAKSGERAVNEAKEAANGASESLAIANDVRASVERGMKDGQVMKQLGEADKRFAGTTAEELGLNTLQGRNDRDLEDKLGVTISGARKGPSTAESGGVAIKDTNYPVG